MACLAEVFGVFRDRVKYGSGYLVGRRLVLTCAHVVRSSDGSLGAVEVHVNDHPRGRVAGRVVWSRYDGEESGVDAALIEIADENWRPPPGFRSVRWGMPDDEAPGVPMYAVGFPAALQRPGERRETLGARGTFNPASIARRRRHLATVEFDFYAAPDGSSNWSGFSGSPVFGLDAGADLLLGVVAEDPLVVRSPALTFIPTRGVLEDEDATRVLRKHGVSLSRRAWSRHLSQASKTPRLPLPRTFEVDLLPCTWRAETGPPGFQCTERVRLDSLAGLVSGPLLLSVGSHGVFPPLAATLQDLRDTQPWHEASPRRAWFELPKSGAWGFGDAFSVGHYVTTRDDDWAAAVRDASEGSRVGLVLPLVLESTGPTAAQLHAVRETAVALRSVLRLAAFVVHVHAERPLDAAVGVQRVQQVLDLDATRWTGMLFVAGGETTAGGGLSPGGGLNSLVIRLRALCEERRLVWDLPPTSGAGAGAVPDPAQIVADLNLRNLESDAEQRLLRQARELLPHLYSDLIAAHANGRDGGARYRSLAVAAERRSDLAVWRQAHDRGGPGGWPEPERMPVELLERHLCEAVLVDMLGERAEPDLVAAWVADGVGQPVRIVGHLAEWTPDGWRLELSAPERIDPEAVRLVARAAVACRQTVAELPAGSENQPLFWAMLLGGPLTDEVLDAVHQLPKHLRPVLGRDGADDIETSDHSAWLRQHIPGITRGPR